jgi:hypothetical protein
MRSGYLLVKAANCRPSLVLLWPGLYAAPQKIPRLAMPRYQKKSGAVAGSFRTLMDVGLADVHKNSGILKPYLEVIGRHWMGTNTPPPG